VLGSLILILAIEVERVGFIHSELRLEQVRPQGWMHRVEHFHLEKVRADFVPNTRLLYLRVDCLGRAVTPGDSKQGLFLLLCTDRLVVGLAIDAWWSGAMTR
jgi:hypothetical protein